MEYWMKIADEIIEILKYKWRTYMCLWNDVIRAALSNM